MFFFRMYLGSEDDGPYDHLDSEFCRKVHFGSFKFFVVSIRVAGVDFF